MLGVPNLVTCPSGGERGREREREVARERERARLGDGVWDGRTKRRGIYRGYSKLRTRTAPRVVLCS